jgi:hypothetical protein
VAIPDDDPGPRAELPPGLLERLRRDPVRAPEHLALAAAEWHAPAAEAWVAERRSRYSVSHRELALMAKKRHAGLARLSGAATGVGGAVTLLPDLALAAWIQSRLVFFVAASFDLDPRDPLRPAELLVLRDLYDDTTTARRALDGVGTTVAEAYVTRSTGADRALVSRLARFVGRRTAKSLGRRLIPGFAIAFNAIGNERETRALADRAIAFYGGLPR